MTAQNISLETGWHRWGRTRRLLPEGYHNARCEGVHVNSSGQIEATFVVTEEGEHYGRPIPHRFDGERDADALYEFLSHLGVPEEARSVNIKKLADVPILVYIRHARQPNGAYQESITGYRAVPGTP